jgi:hypothetical protein
MSQEILLQEFEAIKNDIIALYDAKGMRASGDFANSLQVVLNGETSVKLIGNDYAVQLQQGRKAGKFPPIEAIKKWIEDKGVFAQVLNEIKLSSLAFLIARKIAQEGWGRQDKGGVELISSVITEQRIQSIINKVGEVEAVKFTNTLINMLKSINNE